MTTRTRPRDPNPQSEIVNRQSGIDLVYILGSGSQWRNNELRFSLRSVQKNLKGYRNIYIVGENPGFLKNTSPKPQIPSPKSQVPGSKPQAVKDLTDLTELNPPHHKIFIIEHPDEIGPHNADGNIIRKVIRACREKGLSDYFLKMNDDYIIAHPTTASEIYPVFKCNLATQPESYFKGNHWRSRLQRTRDHLIQAGLPALHFDYHAPIIFCKHDFPQIVNRFDYASDVGLTMRSLYGNVKYPDARKLTNEKKIIFKPHTLQQIQEKVAAATYFIAYNDDGLNDALKYWLITNFTDPSMWETGQVKDKICEVYLWQYYGRDYKTGLGIIENHNPKPHLLKQLQEGECRRNRIKLNFLLNQKTEAL